MELYIMRHGQTIWNKAGKLQGNTDIKLTEEGIRLARITADALRDISFDRIFSSPLSRALDTARIMNEGRDLPIAVDERLREYCFGEVEGYIYKDHIYVEDSPIHKFFMDTANYIPVKGGEDLDVFLGRAKEFMTECIEPLEGKAERVLIVAHGAMIKALLCHIKGHGISKMWTGIHQKNCNIAIVDFTDGKYTVKSEENIFYPIENPTSSPLDDLGNVIEGKQASEAKMSIEEYNVRTANEENFTSRTEKLIGKEACDLLAAKKVLVFGVGGVGGFVCEALARAGIGEFLLVDNDDVNLTNVNRQIIALHSTLGRKKTEVMRERILDINPEAIVHTREEFFLPENASTYDFSYFDYIVDAIDTVTGKIEIIRRADEAGVKVISAMGAGNKLDPTKFVVTDIYKTSVCPLAKVMRKELKARGVKACRVVYSTEEPVIHDRPPGSISFVPSVCGLIVAGEVIKDLIK